MQGPVAAVLSAVDDLIACQVPDVAFSGSRGEHADNGVFRDAFPGGAGWPAAMKPLGQPGTSLSSRMFPSLSLNHAAL